MPLGSQQKITLIGTQLPGELQIASAVGATGNVLTISPTEQSRINVSTVHVLIIADTLYRTQIPLSIHSFMALQVALASMQTRVYLALPGPPGPPYTFLLYRLAAIGPREPTFLLVQESVAPHVIEVLDPAFTQTP